MATNMIFIEKLSGFFILQWGWKRAFSAFIFGALSALGMAPLDLFFILFVTFPVLVWLIDGTAADPGRTFLARIRPSFVIGWSFGFGYFLAGLWWIGAALLVEQDVFVWFLPLAVLGIPAFLALFWASGIAIARIFWSDDWRRIFMLAVFISLGEYARGTVLTGFPWNTIGYAPLINPLMMQSAALIGVYGITPLAIIIFASPVIFSPGWSQKRRQTGLFLFSVILLGASHVGFGYWRLRQNPPEFVKGVNIRIVQPAIRQQDKWVPEKESEIFNSFIDLSNSKYGEISHFIWPESAFPFILTQRRDALAAIADMLPQDAYLITGAMRVERAVQDEENPKIFNSVYVINHKGEITGAADKSHLVPFGEYLPFQEYAQSLGLQQLTGIENGFAAGAKRGILTTKSAGSFLPLICYEIIFPSQIRPQNVNSNTSNTKVHWIVNVTNDAWFGGTWGPYQHHRQAVIRGIEEGLPVIRASNSGISSISDSYGRIHGYLELGKRGSVDGKLPLPAVATIFVRYGNTGFAIICTLLFLISFWRRNGKSRN